MSKTTKRLSVWIAIAALLLALFIQMPAPAYAASTSIPEVEVTGYTIIKGTTNPFNGRINRGDIITIQLSILDTRITGTATPAPSASLNTAAFTATSSTVINTTPGAPTQSTSGLTYTLQFTNLKYTGTVESFSCNISYPNYPPAPGSPLPMVNVSLTLNQLVQYVPQPQPPTDPGEPPPGVIDKPTDFVLKDARFGDGTVYAGEEFVLSVVILATNGTFPVENVSVTFSPPEQLTLSGGASVVYIGTMHPNTSVPVSVGLFANANVPEGTYPVTITATGMNQNSGAPAGGGMMTVAIPVLQPERFEIFDAMLPTDLTAGVDDGLGFSTVTLVNKGKGTVANVTVEIVGEGLRTDIGRQYLGNVAAGEQKVADFIMYGDIPGEIEGKVLVLYENVRGDQMTLERPFTVFVNEGWFEDPGFSPEPWPPDEPVSTGPPTWLWILIAIAAAVVVTVLLLRRRKKRLAAAEAALDELDDDD